MMNRDNPVWIIDPKVSRLGYWLVYAMGILQLFAAGALAYSGTMASERALAALLACSALLFLAVARLLGTPRGGAAFLPGSGEVALFALGLDDRYSVPLGSLSAIRLLRRTELWGRSEEAVLISSVELESKDGTYMLLLELPTLDDAREAAHAVRSVLKLPVVEPAEEDPPGEAPSPIPHSQSPVPGSPVSPDAGLEAGAPATPADVRPATTVDNRPPTILRIGFGWGLSPVVFLLALFCLASGVLLLAGLSATGVLGFLFGPVAVLLGLLLLALWLFKGLGAERLSLLPGAVEHEYRLGGLRFGARRLEAGETGFRSRVRTRGPSGFSLEIMSGGRILSAGNGAGKGTGLPVAELAGLGRRVAERSRAGGPHAA